MQNSPLSCNAIRYNEERTGKAPALPQPAGNVPADNGVLRWHHDNAKQDIKAGLHGSPSPPSHTDLLLHCNQILVFC